MTIRVFFSILKMEDRENSRKLAFLFRPVKVFEALLLPSLKRRKTLVVVLLSHTCNTLVHV